MSVNKACAIQYLSQTMLLWSQMSQMCNYLLKTSILFLQIYFLLKFVCFQINCNHSKSVSQSIRKYFFVCFSFLTSYTVVSPINTCGTFNTRPIYIDAGIGSY